MLAQMTHYADIMIPCLGDTCTRPRFGQLAPNFDISKLLQHKTLGLSVWTAWAFVIAHGFARGLTTMQVWIGTIEPHV